MCGTPLPTLPLEFIRVYRNLSEEIGKNVRKPELVRIGDSSEFIETYREEIGKNARIFELVCIGNSSEFIRHTKRKGVSNLDTPFHIR